MWHMSKVIYVYDFAFHFYSENVWPKLLGKFGFKFL